MSHPGRTPTTCRPIPNLTGVRKANRHVDERAERESECHHLAGGIAVRDDSVQETSDTVDDSAAGQEGPELDLRDADLPEERHRDRQVLADDVVERIADHRDGQRLPLPESETTPQR